MRFSLIPLLIFFSLFCFAQEKKVTYDFSCLDSDFFSSATNLFGDIEKEMLNNFGDEVSFKEELEVGEIVYKECRKKFKFIETGAEIENLKKILSALEKNIANARGFTYSIYLLDTTMLNAFTAGGKIFFTTEMYRFCQSDDERAAIIGHEIYHNELGHISENISREKTAKSYMGEGVGQITAFLGSLLTTPFNQKNEAHCDLTGTELIRKSGFKPCGTVDLWERMKAKEGLYDPIHHMFNSHPYSGKRVDCTVLHIKNNYAIDCFK